MTSLPRSPTMRKMLPTGRRVRTALVAACVLASLAVSQAASKGRVTGVLLDADGRPARGHALVVLDAQGKEVGRGAASPSGRYAVDGIPRGTYTMVVEAPDGTRAVVAAPPLVLRGGKHRLHLRLVEQGDESAAAVPTTGQWWGSLPTSGKVWVIAGVTALTAVAVAGLDDDGDEVPASPSNPD